MSRTALTATKLSSGAAGLMGTQMAAVVMLFSGVFFGIVSSSPEGADLPGGLNLRIQRRGSNGSQAPYSVFGELQHYKSAFLYFPTPYTVQDGDTIVGLADKSSKLVQEAVSAQDIREMNVQLQHFGDDDVLPLRLALNIPGYPAIPPPPTTLILSDTKTLLTFVRAYRVSLDQVQEANPGLDVTDISKVTTIRVPAVQHYPVLECPADCHCVATGETLTEAAQQVGLPSEELLVLNDNVLRQGGRLFIGQALATTATAAANPPDLISVEPYQNPYQVLLSFPNFPLTPSFLAKLSKANNLSLTDLLSVRGDHLDLIVPGMKLLLDPSAALKSSDSSDEVVPSSGYDFDINAEPNAAVVPLKDYRVRINQATYSPAPAGRRRALLPGETVGLPDELPAAPVMDTHRAGKPATDVEAFDYLDQQQIAEQEAPNNLQDPVVENGEIPVPHKASQPAATVSSLTESSPVELPPPVKQAVPAVVEQSLVQEPASGAPEDLLQRLLAAGFTREVAAAVTAALAKKESSSKGKDNTGVADAQLTTDYVKQFAQSVFNALDAPGPASEDIIAAALEPAEEEEEDEEEEEVSAHASSIGDLSSIISAAALSGDNTGSSQEAAAAAPTPSSVRAAAMQALEHEDLQGDGVAQAPSSESAAASSNESASQDLVVKLLGIIRDETHDVRLDHILEELGTSAGKAKDYASAMLQQAQKLAASK